MATQNKKQQKQSAVTGSEKTGGQVPTLLHAPFLHLIGAGSTTLLSPLPASHETYRRMGRHPTLALTAALSVAPIVSSEWLLKAGKNAPKGAEELIGDNFLSIRDPFLETSLTGGAMFGWQGYEKIFKEQNGVIVLRKLKPLLQEITIILVSPKTGAFAGFKQRGVALPLDNSLLINFHVKGTQWHGESLFENARGVWNDWREANAGAARYDRKLAGSHFVIYYPVGESKDASGTTKSNSELAIEIMRALESSGSVAVPRILSQYIGELNAESAKGMGTWEITILEDRSARQPSFVRRLSYLDKLMVRSLLLPERSILEGQYGTKAEAATHINLALTQADLTHRHVTRLLNWHAVDQLLALNYGNQARGTVKLVASPLVDIKLQIYKDAYAEILKNPEGFSKEYAHLDTLGLKEALGIPVLQEQDIKQDPIPPPPADKAMLPYRVVDEPKKI